MEQSKRKHFEARARVLMGIALQNRLFIVEELEKQGGCICELTDMIGADVSTASRCLSALKQEGIVLKG